MGKKGQSIILFCLILSAVLLTLLGSIMVSLSRFNKNVTRLKTRILGYQATIQISQIIQQGRSIATKYPTCVVPPSSSLTLVSVGGKPLCLPADKICVNNQFQYCVAKDPNYLISKHIPNTSDEIYSATRPLFNFDFSLFPKAFAQTKSKPWFPSITGAPTASIEETGFAANKATVCGAPAASSNAECFKIRICTNGSNTCSDEGDYFNVLVAIVTTKLP